MKNLNSNQPIQNFHCGGKTRRRLQRGVTLVELAIVVTVLSIISAGLFIAAGGLTDNARTSALTSQLQTIETANQLVNVQTGCWANSIDFLNEVKAANNSCGASTLTNYQGPYLSAADFDGITLKLDSVQPDTYALIVTTTVGRQLELHSSDESIVNNVADSLCGDNATLPASVDKADRCGITNLSGNRVLLRWLAE